jgi:type I restriction enzyme M protein
MANLVYTGEQDVYTPGIFRTIYDPACGTGGMLSESEKLILGQNERAELALYGQEYNDESWAICCSDMLIKDDATGVTQITAPFCAYGTKGGGICTCG